MRVLEHTSDQKVIKFLPSAGLHLAPWWAPAYGGALAFKEKNANYKDSSGAAIQRTNEGLIFHPPHSSKRGVA